MKKIMSFVLLLIMLFSITGAFASEDASEMLIERAKVLSVEDYENPDEELMFEAKLVTLKLLSGELKGEIVEIQHLLSGSYAYDLPVKAGDKVLVAMEYNDEGVLEIHISEYIRDTYVYVVLAVFILLLILIGRKTGFKAVLTLGLTLLVVMKLLLPGILRGYSPIALTVFSALIITLITIFTIGGFNLKSMSAILGIFGGVMAAGLIAFIIGSRVKLTGLSSEEAMMLLYIPQNIQFDFKELLFSGIILGAMGAVMDVGMSIASAMEEIKRVNPSISAKELVISGMNVGKDIMGTMSNTLILAYVGSAIPMLLLFMAYDSSIVKIINLDIIATEIVRAVAGTIGIILAIPITAITGGVLYNKFGVSKTK